MRIEPKCFAFFSDGTPKKTDQGDLMRNCVAFASNGYLAVGWTNIKILALTYIIFGIKNCKLMVYKTSKLC